MIEPPSREGPPARVGVIPPAVFDRSRARPSAALGPLVPLFALDALTAFTVGMLPPLLPLVAGEWALSAVEAGLVHTAYAIGRLAGSYPASRGRARWGTRTAVFVGLAGLIGGSIACGLAATFPVFLAWRLVMGLGASVTMFAIFAELLESAPASWRGRAANAFEAMAILSLAAGSVLAAAVAERAGWRVVFFGAGLVMGLTVVTWRYISPHAGRGGAAAGGAWPTLSGLRALTPVYGACLAMTMTWAGLFATLVPLVGDRRYGLAAGAIGLAMGAGYVADMIGLAGMGLVIDRVRQEPLFLGGALTVTVGALLLASGEVPAVFVAATILIGGGFAVWMIPATVLVARVGTPLPPAHLAVFRIAMDVGMIVGPLALGGLAELAGDRAAVIASGAFFVMGAVALGRRAPGRGR